MATEKGLFKNDLERSTREHQDMCLWFLNNAQLFVRLFLFDRPAAEVSVTLEHLIVNKGFIIGYVDVLLDYETDFGVRECVLIEVKSRLADQAACLRQVRAYKAHLPSVTKICVCHADERYKPYDDSEVEMRRYFATQGIYVACFHSPFHNPNRCSLPTGRREVSIETVCPPIKLGGNDWFQVSLKGTGFDENGKDATVEVFLCESAQLARPFANLVSVNIEPWYSNQSAEPFQGMKGIRLLLDVEHTLSLAFLTEGYTYEKISKIHLPDLSRTLSL